MEAEIEELRSKLKESESQQIAIAALAKGILEKDKDKDRRLSALGEENLQQSRDIARLQALLKTRDEYLTDAENEVSKLRNLIAEMNDSKSAYMIELEQKISSLRAQVTENNGIVCDREQEIQELKKNLLSKERELEEALRKPLGEVSNNQTRDSFIESEKAKLSEKVNELEMERNMMMDEIAQLQDKVALITRDLDNERAHVDELTTICDGYRHDIGELRQRCNDLTAELNEYRSSTKMAKKGNSMFFEFVDERVKLEKDLLKLKAQNDFFVSQKEAYESELNELRHELMLALSLRSADGNSGGDTSALQQEICRLRTELSAVNAKLLEKNKEKVTVAADDDSSGDSQTVDLKDYAFNNLREEVRILSRKLDIAQKERAEYFDKFRECENRYSEETRRVRELMNEIACLKKRFAVEQKKNAQSAVTQNLKLPKEKLSEKIADINKIDAGDPTISEGLNSFSLTNCSLTSARTVPLSPLQEEEVAAEVTAATNCTEQTVDSGKNDSNGQKDIPVEKRLKFQLPDEGTSWLSIRNRNKEDVYPVKRKPKRKIIRKVCEARNL